MYGADALDPRTLVLLGLKLSVLVILIFVYVGQRRRAWILRRDLDRLGKVWSLTERGPANARRPLRTVQPAARRRRPSRR